MKNDAVYDYYQTIVKPTLLEAFSNKADIRKARLAAIVLDQMRDYRAIQLGNNLSASKVLESMLPSCEDALILRDVCNATKHGMLNVPTRNPKLSRQLTHTDQVKKDSNPGIFNAPFGQGMFGESNHVYIKFDDSRVPSRRLHDVLFNVDQYWQSALEL